MPVERDIHGFDAPAPLEHPARASLPDEATTGPGIGDRLPDFSLFDAHGKLLNFHQHRGNSKAAIIFYRSAVW